MPSAPRRMTRPPMRLAACLLLISVALSSAARAGICETAADLCWDKSYDEFVDCGIDCYIPPPFGAVGILACLTVCEVAWLARNTVCATDYATCLALQHLRQDPEEPILIDLDRNNFHLVGLEEGVWFDIDADGVLEQISWTSAGEEDGFLCRDQNNNGIIDDGSELFGNATPLMLMSATAVNGFHALQELDAPSLGGNVDGYIDASDDLYGDLCVWVDENQNGFSEVGEVRSLSDAGVQRLDVAHSEWKRVDSHGNEFVYRGQAWIETEQGTKRTHMMDVDFVGVEDEE